MSAKANAHWKGTLKEGKGKMSFTGYEGPYTFASRFEDGKETNPEELIGAAHAGCYSMFLAALLSKEELNPDSIDTTAEVTLDKDDTGPHIAFITLNCIVKCAGIEKEKLQKLAKTAMENCPVSRLYKGGTAKIEVNTTLM
jgi:osmotically inducible protein OsmC